MKDHWKVSRQKEPKAKQDQHHHKAKKELVRERWTDRNQQRTSSWSHASRGCHGCIPEDCIRALYPYPLRISAEDAYPKRIMRKGGQDISILSDKKFEIISDPYPRYESQDTGIYIVMRRPAPGEFWLNEVDLFSRVPTIGGLMSQQLAGTSGDPARPGWNRSIKRLDPIALLSECNTRFRTVILTSVFTNGGEPPRRRPLGS